MADRVEQVMHDMVPELNDLIRKRIFNETEVKHIVKRRRDFEYKLLRNPSQPEDYLNYVRYEVALESLRRRRHKELRWRKKSTSDHAGIRRLHDIFSRATRKFKGDVRMWYQHIDFCTRTGSSKIMGAVLLRAVKFHPREVPLWLLAADRELRCGHVAAARALLLRGLRFSAKSVKLWSEFFRLEAQIAETAQAARDGKTETEHTNEGSDGGGEAIINVEEARAKTDAWAPARLVLRRACHRLAGMHKACLEFLTTVVRILGDEEPGGTTSCPPGQMDLRQEVQKAIREALPRCGGCADVPSETAAGLWQLWWNQELARGRSWLEVIGFVCAEAPAAAVRQAALVLASVAGTPDAGNALLTLAGTDRATQHTELSFAILEALDHCILCQSRSSVKPADAAAAAKVLLKRAATLHPNCMRIQALALQQQPVEARTKGAAELALRVSTTQSTTPALAAQLLLLAGVRGRTSALASLLRAPVSDGSELQLAQQLVQTFLADALAQGPGELRCACEEVLGLAAQLWDAPQRKAQVLATILDVQLRAMTPAKAEPHWLCRLFEQLLDCLDDSDENKMDVWLKYCEFSQRMWRWGRIDGVPSTTDLHWRAMRSVGNQMSYAERANRLLQLGTS